MPNRPLGAKIMSCLKAKPLLSHERCRFVFQQGEIILTSPKQIQIVRTNAHAI